MMSDLRQPGRLASLVSGLALAAIALAGCSSTPSSPSTSGSSGGGDDDVTAITVGGLPTSNFAPLQVALTKGFFEEEGLEVTVQNVGSGSELITGLLAGTFQFTGAGVVPTLTAISQGLPIKIIAGNDGGAETLEEDWHAIVSLPDGPQTPEDVATATVAVNALKGVQEVTLRASLEELGIDTSGLSLVEIPFPEMPAALEQGTVDAAYASEPFLSAVLGAGGSIVHAPYVTLGVPNGSWQASDELIASDPETVDAFTRAITKALEYCAENPDAVREAIPTFTQTPAEVAAAMHLPVFSAELEDDAIERLIGATGEFGVIEDELTLDDVLYRP
ncbi:MAG: nitrate transporter substrate-binding protein [Naasia sp.]|nr:nitrate transporter substrate-binding protein [Naasia sp.]